MSIIVSGIVGLIFINIFIGIIMLAWIALYAIMGNRFFYE